MINIFYKKLKGYLFLLLFGIGIFLNSSVNAASANNIQMFPFGSGAVLALDSATGNVSFCTWSCAYQYGNVGASTSGFVVTPSTSSGNVFVYILNKQTGKLYQCYSTPQSACQLSGNTSSM